MKTTTAYYDSPIGLIEITGTAEGILSVKFVEESVRQEPETYPCVKDCIAQLDGYFRGTRRAFSVNVILQGTEFQKQVWRQLMTIPCGETVSYQDIAIAIGKPTACRAVGSANGKNNISIIIPCHRVIGSDGKLTGYGGGLWRKEWLLQHERGLCSPK
jgi:methylated-DNA-[protein]-cysteine S-methyltransferase